MNLIERFRNWRRQKIADPKFRHWAGTFRLTRPIANQQANALFRISSGFVFSQILYLLVSENILQQLADKPDNTETLARGRGWDPAKLDMLLEAARGIGILTRTGDGRWQIDDFGAVVANDEGIAAMIRHHKMFYDDLREPSALLTVPAPDTRLRDFWSYATADDPASVPDDIADSYSRLMRISQTMMAEAVCEAYDFSGHHTLLDVGGGHGAFLEYVASVYPHLQLRLFDLPPVAGKAIEQFRGPAQRLKTSGGNFFEDALPDDCDCVALIRIVCDHDDAAAVKLLKNVRRSMQPGAKLLIAEAMAGRRVGESLATAYFNLYFLAMGSGKCRSAKEIGDLLKEAGFERFRQKTTPIPLISGLIVAEV